MSKKSFLSDIEEQILEVWQKEDTFAKSLKNREDGKHFEFYDGPPFANGLPHYGHIISSIVKDAIPRYKTMRGYHVPRRFGWDCHGLPAEMKAEQDLGLGSKADIEKYGVKKFVDYCKSSVTEFTEEWEYYVNRIGRWVDFEDNYYTMDLGYMESVMWAFKKLYEDGLVSEGYKVMPYCHVCETSLSHFETRQDDSYRDRIDPAVTVRFPLDSGETLLAWTTTPWTLPANLAVAVNKDVQYSVLEGNGERLVLATEVKERYEEELKDYKEIAKKKGVEFIGAKYEPPFNYYQGHENSHVVMHADFVNAEDGTGVAHEAPGFGEDDQKLCEEHGIEIVVPVDKQGNFTDEIKAFAGQNVFDANKGVIEVLKTQGKLFKHEQYKHSYPHCWRTDNPLIYRAVASWTVDVPKLKKQLITNNKKIDWIPVNVKEGAFGKWLEGVRVWNVSRDRYWGTPIPVWKTDDGKTIVCGSVAEIKERAVDPSKVTDLHKPAIDDVVLKTDDGKLAHRVPEVLDVWFDSGSMPFAQHNYPFTDPTTVEFTDNTSGIDSSSAQQTSKSSKFKHPADFIVEYIGQVRGWFYTLHVLATALFDEPAFTSVISHGVILGSDGRKMSKRLGNYPDLQHVFDVYGADALRYYLFESPILRGETIAIDETAIRDAQRNVLMTFWNSYKFFKTYSEVDEWKTPKNVARPSGGNLLDQWILTRLDQTTGFLTDSIDKYEIPKGLKELRLLVDDLSNWYIRRSRRRFWKSESDEDKEAAYNTLWYSLIRVSQLLAPWSPFISDYVYRDITTSSKLPTSVHLTDWPEKSEYNKGVLEDMKMAREAIAEALSQRAEAKIKVRQPLAFVEIVTTKKLPVQMQQVIEKEVNVKKANLKVASSPSVKLNTKLTNELRHEGYMREALRYIQNHRKKAGLNVEDRIKLSLTGDKALLNAIEAYKDDIAKEVLATSIDESNKDYQTDVLIEGLKLRIGISKN